MAKLNQGGRPRGSKNKVAKDLREAIKEMVVNYFISSKFIEDLRCLSPAERASVMNKVTSFIVPRLKSVELNVSAKQKESIEDQLRRLAAEFKDN